MTSTVLLKVACLGLLLAASASAANILILSHLQGSHVAELATIGEELASRKHNVYSVLPSSSDKTKKSLMQKGFNILDFPAKEGDVYMDSPEFNQQIAEMTVTNDPAVQMKILELAGEVTSLHCRRILDNEALMQQLRDLKFSMIVLDAFVVNYCFLIFSQKLSVPFISGFSSIPSWVMGIPALPSFVPTILSQFNDRMTFQQKMISIFHHYIINSPNLAYYMVEKEILKEYCPEISDWTDLLKQTQLYLCYRDELLERPVPEMQNTIFLPGMTYAEPKPLPKDLARIFTQAKNGVILVSFGSTAGYLPDKILKRFLSAFKTLKGYDIIWKFPTKALTERSIEIPSNVHLSNWLPQNDCLGHKKTKLFITHCGNNGQYEALYHAVPMLGFPLFAEQPHNAFRIQDRGYGLFMDIHTFGVHDLVESINHILNNETYFENVKLASQIMKSETHPKVEAAYWIEHVMKFGGEHLRGASMDLPLYKLLMLDILLFFVAIITLIVLVLYCALKYLCRNAKKQKRE